MNNFSQKNIINNLNVKTELPNKSLADVSLKANQIIYSSINDTLQKMCDNDLYIERAVLNNSNVKYGPRPESELSNIDNSENNSKYWTGISGNDSSISIIQKIQQPIEDTLSCILSGTPNLECNTIYQIKNNTVVGTNRGLYAEVDKFEFSLIQNTLSNHTINTFYTDNIGVYLIGTENGVYSCAQLDQLSCAQLVEGTVGLNVTALNIQPTVPEIEDNFILIGTTTGLYHSEFNYTANGGFDVTSVTNLRQDETIRHESIRVIKNVGVGSYLIGTNAGLYKAVLKYGAIDIDNIEVQGIHDIRLYHDILFVGTSHGLYYINDAQQAIQLSNITSAEVLKLYTVNDQLVVSVVSDGLCVLTGLESGLNTATLTSIHLPYNVSSMTLGVYDVTHTYFYAFAQNGDMYYVNVNGVTDLTQLQPPTTRWSDNDDSNIWKCADRFSVGNYGTIKDSAFAESHLYIATTRGLIKVDVELQKNPAKKLVELSSLTDPIINTTYNNILGFNIINLGSKIFVVVNGQIKEEYSCAKTINSVTIGENNLETNKVECFISTINGVILKYLDVTTWKFDASSRLLMTGFNVTKTLVEFKPFYVFLTQDNKVYYIETTKLDGYPLQLSTASNIVETLDDGLYVANTQNVDFFEKKPVNSIGKYGNIFGDVHRPSEITNITHDNTNLYICSNEGILKQNNLEIDGNVEFSNFPLSNSVGYNNISKFYNRSLVEAYSGNTCGYLMATAQSNTLSVVNVDGTTITTNTLSVSNPIVDFATSVVSGDNKAISLYADKFKKPIDGAITFIATENDILGECPKLVESSDLNNTISSSLYTGMTNVKIVHNFIGKNVDNYSLLDCMLLAKGSPTNSNNDYAVILDSKNEVSSGFEITSFVLPDNSPLKNFTLSSVIPIDNSSASNYDKIIYLWGSSGSEKKLIRVSAKDFQTTSTGNPFSTAVSQISSLNLKVGGGITNEVPISSIIAISYHDNKICIARYHDVEYDWHMEVFDGIHGDLASGLELSTDGSYDITTDWGVDYATDIDNLHDLVYSSSVDDPLVVLAFENFKTHTPKCIVADIDGQRSFDVANSLSSIKTIVTAPSSSINDPSNIIINTTSGDLFRLESDSGFLIPSFVLFDSGVSELKQTDLGNVYYTKDNNVYQVLFDTTPPHSQLITTSSEVSNIFGVDDVAFADTANTIAYSCPSTASLPNILYRDKIFGDTSSDLSSLFPISSFPTTSESPTKITCMYNFNNIIFVGTDTNLYVINSDTSALSIASLNIEYDGRTASFYVESLGSFKNKLYVLLKETDTTRVLISKEFNLVTMWDDILNPQVFIKETSINPYHYTINKICPWFSLSTPTSIVQNLDLVINAIQYENAGVDIYKFEDSYYINPTQSELLVNQNINNLKVCDNELFVLTQHGVYDRVAGDGYNIHSIDNNISASNITNFYKFDNEFYCSELSGGLSTSRNIEASFVELVPNSNLSCFEGQYATSYVTHVYVANPVYNNQLNKLDFSLNVNGFKNKLFNVEDDIYYKFIVTDSFNQLGSVTNLLVDGNNLILNLGGTDTVKIYNIEDGDVSDFEITLKDGSIRLPNKVSICDTERFAVVENLCYKLDETDGLYKLIDNPNNLSSVYKVGSRYYVQTSIGTFYTCKKFDNFMGGVLVSDSNFGVEDILVDTVNEWYVCSDAPSQGLFKCIYDLHPDTTSILAIPYFWKVPTTKIYTNGLHFDDETQQYINQYIITSQNNIYSSLDGVDWEKIISLPSGLEIKDILARNNEYEFLIGTNKGLYKTSYEYSLINTYKSYSDDYFTESIYGVYDAELSNHMINFHSASNLIPRINAEKMAVDFSDISNTWQTKSTSANLSVVNNDIVDTVVFNDDIHNDVSATYSNFTTYDETLSSNTFKPISNVSYIVKTWKSGVVDMYVYLPTTNTYYMNHDAGNVDCENYNVELMRNNIPTPMNLSSDVGQNYTTIRVSINSNVYDIDKVLNVQIAGNSLPLKIFKDNTYTCGGSAKMFHSFILPSTAKGDILDVQTPNAENELTFEFYCSGSDAQAIHLTFTTK